MKKSFLVVEAVTLDCGAIGWECPFCHAEGETHDPTTEYFSVHCHENGIVFLVHREPPDELPEPCDTDITRPVVYMEDRRPGTLHYHKADFPVATGLLAIAEHFAVLSAAMMRNQATAGTKLAMDLGYEALSQIRDKAVAAGYAKDVGILATWAMVHYFVYDYSSFDKAQMDDIVRSLINSAQQTEGGQQG